MCMALNKTDQERLLTFGTMAGTKAANGGRMHEEHMMQRVRAEEPVAKLVSDAVAREMITSSPRSSTKKAVLLTSSDRSSLEDSSTATEPSGPATSRW